MRLLAIDPGTTESAWLIYDTETRVPVEWDKALNERVLVFLDSSDADQLAIENVASYGMTVGAEVFSTCIWIGRFSEAWRRRSGRLPMLVFRRECKLHLCGSARAKDANVRQALIDRYGPGRETAIGRKASPGVLYGVSGDVWSALAVAVTAAESNEP